MRTRFWIDKLASQTVNGCDATSMTGPAMRNLSRHQFFSTKRDHCQKKESKPSSSAKRTRSYNSSTSFLIVRVTATNAGIGYRGAASVQITGKQQQSQEFEVQNGDILVVNVLAMLAREPLIASANSSDSICIVDDCKW